MKRETLKHPKTLHLASALDVDRPTALGYLTLLWDFTADCAIQGDIGKWPNGAIARACDFLGDADVFVSALIDAGWLDPHDAHRLLVHHWPDHCENWVKAKMKKQGIRFCEAYCDDANPTEGGLSGLKSTSDASAERTAERSADASAVRSPPRDRTKPNQTQRKRKTCAKRGAKSNDSAFFLSKVTKSLLECPEALLRWFDSARVSFDIPNTDAARMDVLAASARSLERGENPAALFVSIIKNRQFDLFTTEQENTARRQFAEWRRQRTSPPSEATLALADVLARRSRNPDRIQDGQEIDPQESSFDEQQRRTEAG